MLSVSLTKKYHYFRDSAGADFAEHHGQEAQAAATFSMHTGFDDPSDGPDAPERESIEVRCVAFFTPERSRM